MRPLAPAVGGDALRTRLLRGLLSLGLMLMVGCGADERGSDPGTEDVRSTTDTIVDAAGTPHATAPRPERVISLVPSATETLIAIGADDRLVARTDFDDFDAVRDLPSIGMGLQPNLEAILARSPDLVLYFHGESDQTTPRRLREAGIRTVAVRPDRIEDVRKMIRDLGALTHRTDAARVLLEEIDRGLDEVASRVEGLEPVATVFTLGGEPPWVAGPDSYVDQLLRVAGGRNVFDDIGQLYGPVSVEAFLAREIEVVLAEPGAELPEAVAGIGVRRLPDFIDLPGPRLHEAARAIGRALHPDVFR